MNNNNFLEVKNDLIKLVNSLNLIDNNDKALKFLGIVSKFFRGINIGYFYKRNNDPFFYLILNIFENRKFKNNLLEIIRVKELKSEKDITQQKKIINTFLYLDGLILSLILPYLNRLNILYLRKRITKSLKIIKQESNGIYTLEDICLTLYEIIYDKNNRSFINSTSKVRFFENHELARSLMGSIFLIIAQNNILSVAFKGLLNYKKNCETEGKKFSLAIALNRICRTARKIRAGLDHFSKLSGDIENIYNFIEIFRDKNEKVTAFIIEKMAIGEKGYYTQDNFFEMALNKIINIEKTKKEIVQYAMKNLSAFKGSLGTQWSNKIYLISYKTISALEAIKDTTEKNWKIKVFVREMNEWIEKINHIINKFDLEDDWEKLSKYIDQENSLVEWKSSFLTPIEKVESLKEILPPTNKKIGQNMFKKIVDTIIGMMNSEGGTIIVGLIEKEDRIKEELKKFVLEKNNRFFFDVGQELLELGYNLDLIKRKIQDQVKKNTREEISKFDNYWNIELLQLKGNNKVIEIYKINVKKYKNFLFSIKEGENNIIWISLLKRLNGRTCYTDPRELFKSNFLQ